VVAPPRSSGSTRRRGREETRRREDLDAYGNGVDHEYEIKRDSDVIATLSKKWFRMFDAYRVEIREGDANHLSWP
jgi:uncharacterized protein YxjI